jgi:SNF2 family DNA or RNA helicase
MVLTLTAAKYVIYFSNSYNLEVRQQSEDRAHRIGQKSQVTYIDIICRDTIDQMVLHNLENTRLNCLLRLLVNRYRSGFSVMVFLNSL